MKFVSTQLSYFFSDRTVRRNTRALLKYVGFVLIVVVVFAVLFHFIKLSVEGERYSWVTGFYWTLTVMSTLGFGDITFTSDIGRAFSMLVLMTGIVLLLIVLPFAFIRFFYAPWLEAQIHLKAPRAVPPETKNHVLLCNYDPVVETLLSRLRDEGIEHFVIVPDSALAASFRSDGIPVITGDIDNPETYVKARVEHARMLVANREDTVNTNIILTVREVSPDARVVAIASSEDAVDVMTLSGANEVLPLKRWLGEHLANRVSASRAHTHVIGEYEGLQVAELPVRHTPLSGRTIRETRLREISGVNIIAVWVKGKLHASHPDFLLTENSVPVVTGSPEQLESLDDLLLIYNINPFPVLVIGGGRVGRAAARSLRDKETPVHVVERDARIAQKVRNEGLDLYEGDAEDLHVLQRAGITEAPSVVLTTHDDAMNIYLTSYCRRLNPELRIVSRIEHDRNVESIHRAGADFVLSYASLGAASLYSSLQDNPLLILGQDLSLFSAPVPRSLSGKRLASSDIGARTGLIVIGIRQNGQVNTNVNGETLLPPYSELVMLGDAQQRHRFADVYH